MRFYRLIADPDSSHRWFLDSPKTLSGEQVDPRIFTYGFAVEPQPPLVVPVDQDGERIGFNFAAFDMVVTPAAINEKLGSLAGAAIQRFPVLTDSDEAFEILNVCDLVECLDETRCHVTRWTPSDGRPEKIGEYRMVVGLKIDANRAAGHHIFRVAGWSIALIVSEDVKKLFENAGLSGVVYQRVD
ncbi:hypothetical protein SAMN05428960_0358 [Mitsuaria sp. PDC51]|uniref:imm11 family protein n=1 Tax=Mitsuaria sp. PDC51 TaxID=1881035 RepID=UPI0008E7832F|nr:hypothetical protein SAMN05428960_0358 [Mitsuaria sp. PDC51]